MFSRNSFYVAYWTDLESILLSLASAVAQRLEILSLKKKYWFLKFLFLVNAILYSFYYTKTSPIFS